MNNERSVMLSGAKA